MNNELEKKQDEELEKRTTLTLSLTANDKKALKQMALDRDVTVAALIHAWIVEHEQEV